MKVSSDVSVVLTQLWTNDLKCDGYSWFCVLNMTGIRDTQIILKHCGYVHADVSRRDWHLNRKMKICPHQCGQVSSNSLRAQIEQKGRGKSHSLFSSHLPHSPWARKSIFSYSWTSMLPVLRLDHTTGLRMADF